MNCLSWNCRGTAAKGFSGLIKDLRKEYSASLMFLLETHSSLTAANQAKKSGFLGHFIEDARGQPGGIWCLWDMAMWKVDVLQNGHQFVHIRVCWKGHITWFITVVYASTNYVRRQDLWEDLKRIVDDMEEPWMVLGDFNAILTNCERKGGAQNFSTRGMQNFKNMVQECHLIDAGFQGNPFTWKHGDLYQRLDRAFRNLQ